MIHVRVDDEGLPIFWSSTHFEGSTCVVPFSTPMDLVYFKEGKLCFLPEKSDPNSIWSLSKENWVRNLSAEWSDFRNKRDTLLSKSDWTQVPDAPVDQAAWAAYRQLLRDLPSTTTDPFNVQWPKSPSATNTEGYA